MMRYLTLSVVLSTILVGCVSFGPEPERIPLPYNITKVSSSNGTCPTWIPAILQDYTEVKITRVTWTGSCDKTLYKDGVLEGYGILSGFDKNKQIIFQLKGNISSASARRISFTSFDFNFLGSKIIYKDKYISHLTFIVNDEDNLNFLIIDSIQYIKQKAVYTGNFFGTQSLPNQPKKLEKVGELSKQEREDMKKDNIEIEQFRKKAAAESAQRKKLEIERKKQEQQEAQARRQEQWQQLGQVLGAAATVYTAQQTQKANTARYSKPTPTPTYTPSQTSVYTPPAPTTQTNTPSYNPTPTINYPNSSNGNSSTGRSGNGGFNYETPHNQCIQLETIPNKGKAKDVYGNYNIHNRCNYPIYMRFCAIDNGTSNGPDDNSLTNGIAFSTFVNDLNTGRKVRCPDGFGAVTIAANNVYKGKTWFGYTRLALFHYVCRDGWHPVETNTQKYASTINEAYTCRKLK